MRIVRPCNVYGPRLRGDDNGQVVSMMMESNPIVVHGDGLQTEVSLGFMMLLRAC